MDSMNGISTVRFPYRSLNRSDTRMVAERAMILGGKGDDIMQFNAFMNMNRSEALLVRNHHSLLQVP